MKRLSLRSLNLQGLMNSSDICSGPTHLDSSLGADVPVPGPHIDDQSDKR
jgi:hypothetical protein